VRKFTLPFVVFAIVLALTATACGGGGGESPEKKPGERITDPARVPSSTPVASLISCDDKAPAAGTCYKIAGRQVEVPNVVSAAPSKSVSGAAPAAAPTGGAKKYVVQSGDLCGTIAAEHGVSVDALLKANRSIDANCGNLHAGDELVIPAGGTTATAGSVAPTPTPTAKPGSVRGATASPTPRGGTASGGKTHVVQSNESCEGIAATYGVTTSALIAANSEINSSCSNLQLEQVLTIP